MGLHIDEIHHPNNQHPQYHQALHKYEFHIVYNEPQNQDQ